APTPRLVTGNEVMARFGLAPGPLVGQLVELAQEAQAAGDVTTREQALELIASHINGGDPVDHHPSE
ncbi:MAG: hypothetical protein NTZ05_03735, partial [Chloroflexi bacterium]|nr:hypothetical protein [Chloroflexota bacterium]